MQKKIQKMVLQQQMIGEKETVLAGVSGGADSVCLLLVLEALKKELDFSLEAVHVEHGIRGEESLSDANFVNTLCKSRNIPCHTIFVDVPTYSKENGIGTEEAARILRYEAFVRLAREKQAKIALAHHMEDNAETILFQMLRGSSLTGLCGMQAIRTDEYGITYIRPLLMVHRKEIENFLQSQAQAYCIDSTNTELEYSRNFIRSVILPKLQEINAQAVSHINHTANELRDIHSFLEQESEKAWKSVVQMTEDGGKQGIVSTNIKKEDVSFSQGKSSEEERKEGNGFVMQSPIYVSFEKQKIQSHLKSASMDVPKKVLLLHTKLLQNFHIAIQKEVAYKAIAYMLGGKKDIATVHVQDLLKLCQNQSGKELHLPNGLIAKKEYDYVKLSLKQKNVPMKREKANNLPLTETKCSSSKEKQSIQVHQERLEQEVCRAKHDKFFCASLPSTEGFILEKDCDFLQDGLVKFTTDRDGCFDQQEEIEISAVLLEEWKKKKETIKISLGKQEDILQIRIFSREVKSLQTYRKYSEKMEENRNFNEIPQKRYTKWLDYDKIKNGFCIRTRQSGDAFITDSLGHHKKLKQYFIDEKIPATKRDHLWLIAQEHTVLWLIGGRISEHIKVTEDTRTIIEFTYNGGK